MQFRIGLLSGRGRTELDRIGPDEAFRTLADLFPDAAVFAVDGERNIVHWSDGAQRLLTQAALVGVSFDEVVALLDELRKGNEP